MSGPWAWARRRRVPECLLAVATATVVAHATVDVRVPVPLGTSPLPVWTVLPVVTTLVLLPLLLGRTDDLERSTIRGRGTLPAWSAGVAVAAGLLVPVSFAGTPLPAALAPWSLGLTTLALLARAVLGDLGWMPVLLAGMVLVGWTARHPGTMLDHSGPGVLVGGAALAATLILHTTLARRQG
ncbi:MAG: hypothetical protein PGN07_03535 [Aeromicrobium erythreum]